MIRKPTRAEVIAYHTARARKHGIFGDGGTGACLGCARPLEDVALGVAEGCPICVAWVEHAAERAAMTLEPSGAA